MRQEKDNSETLIWKSRGGMEGMQERERREKETCAWSLRQRIDGPDTFLQIPQRIKGKKCVGRFVSISTCLHKCGM